MAPLFASANSASPPQKAGLANCGLSQITFLRGFWVARCPKGRYGSAPLFCTYELCVQPLPNRAKNAIFLSCELSRAKKWPLPDVQRATRPLVLPYLPYFPRSDHRTSGSAVEFDTENDVREVHKCKKWRFCHKSVYIAAAEKDDMAARMQTLERQRSVHASSTGHHTKRRHPKRAAP